MSDGVVFFFVPTILFVIFVAPMWVYMHYRSKQQSQHQLTEEERHLLDSLATRAEMMAERVETLEAILDAETPGWRTGSHNRMHEGLQDGQAKEKQS